MRARKNILWSLFAALALTLTASAPVAADQVILDDLIVDGSACIGFDCVNGESFGFDTIRIKENNLRIKAQDTSSSASFPTVDWQLTFNDSSNGGANKFSIDNIDNAKTPFTVLSDARTNAIFAKGERVGFGTSTPVVSLHVVSGNTPTLRLEQDGSSGFSSQTWDLAGNEANFFIRDVTNGSKLPFRIRPGAATSTIDISSSGNTGIGTSSPQAKLHMVKGGSTFTLNAATHAAFQNSAAAGDSMIMALIGGASGTSQLGFGRTGGGNSELAGRIVYNHSSDSMDFYASSGFGASVDMTLDGNATNHITMGNGAVLTSGGVWTDASSREYKQDIRPLSMDSARQAVMELAPVSFAYRRQPDETYLGFIAEDVPELVAIGDRTGLAPMDIVAALTKVVQEQQRTIERLEHRLAKVEGGGE